MAQEGLIIKIEIYSSIFQGANVFQLDLVPDAYILLQDNRVRVRALITDGHFVETVKVARDVDTNSQRQFPQLHNIVGVPDALVLLDGFISGVKFSPIDEESSACNVSVS